jgi:hypothetical protein
MAGFLSYLLGGQAFGYHPLRQQRLQRRRQRLQGDCGPSRDLAAADEFHDGRLQAQQAGQPLDVVPGELDCLRDLFPGLVRHRADPLQCFRLLDLAQLLAVYVLGQCHYGRRDVIVRRNPTGQALKAEDARHPGTAAPHPRSSTGRGCLVPAVGARAAAGECRAR